MLSNNIGQLHMNELTKRRTKQAKFSEINKAILWLIKEYIPPITLDRIVFIKGGTAWERQKNTGVLEIQNSMNDPAFVSSNIDMECITHGKLCSVSNDLYKLMEVFTSSLNSKFGRSSENSTRLRKRGDASKSSMVFSLVTSPYVDTVKNKGCPKISPQTGNPMLSNEIGRVGQSFLIYSKESHHTRDEDGDLVFYIGIYDYGVKFNLRKFSMKYLYNVADTNNSEKQIAYLNTHGLYLYLHFIFNDRQDKGVNIDGIRRRLITSKYLPTNIAKEVIDFNEIHTNLRDYHEQFIIHVTNSLYKSVIMKKYPDLISKIESNIVEIYRERVNGVIASINNEIKNKNINGSCFIAGGDAMRRYVGSINSSADIDAKLYYTSQGDRSKILALLVDKLAEFTTKLNVDRDKLNKLYEIKGGWGGMKKLSMPFRFRFIGKRNDWPLDLCTVDCRYLLDNNNVNRTHNYGNTLDHIDGYYATFGLLDIAVMHKKTFNESFDTVSTTDGLAYASKKFLIKDIENTYADNKLRKSRIFVGKTAKNQGRYNELRKNNVAPSQNNKNKLNYTVSNELTQDEMNVSNIYKKLIKKELFNKSGSIKGSVRYKCSYNIKRLLGTNIYNNNMFTILNLFYKNSNNTYANNIHDLYTEKMNVNWQYGNNNVINIESSPNSRNTRRSPRNNNKMNSNPLKKPKVNNPRNRNQEGGNQSGSSSRGVLSVKRSRNRNSMNSNPLKKQKVNNTRNRNQVGENLEWVEML